VVASGVVVDIRVNQWVVVRRVATSSRLRRRHLLLYSNRLNCRLNSRRNEKRRPRYYASYQRNEPVATNNCNSSNASNNSNYSSSYLIKTDTTIITIITITISTTTTSATTLII
jgi:hypothetical protein